MHRTDRFSAAVHDHCDKGNGEGQAPNLETAKDETIGLDLECARSEKSASQINIQYIGVTGNIWMYTERQGAEAVPNNIDRGLRGGNTGDS